MNDLEEAVARAIHDARYPQYADDEDGWLQFEADARAALGAEPVARLVELARLVEWSDIDDGGAMHCPVCANVQEDGHWEQCLFVAAL